MAISDPIGLVGLGLVGKALARRFIGAGYRVVGNDLDTRAGEAAREIGVDVEDDVGSIAERCKLIFFSLPDWRQSIASFGVKAGWDPHAWPAR